MTNRHDRISTARKPRNRRDPDEATTTTQSVYRALRNAIITCEMRPGDSISEQALANLYETSRTPVREACNLLHKEGLLDSIPHKGFFVPEMTLQKVQDLYQARMIVESACAEIAAKQINPRELEELENCAFPKVRGRQKELLLDYVSRNTRFHLSIAKATGNAYLVELVRRLHDQATRVEYLQVTRELEVNLDREVKPEHEEVVKAIKSRDPEAAREAMARHIRGSLETLLNSMLNKRFGI